MLPVMDNGVAACALARGLRALRYAAQEMRSSVVRNTPLGRMTKAQSAARCVLDMK